MKIDKDDIRKITKKILQTTEINDVELSRICSNLGFKGLQVREELLAFLLEFSDNEFNNLILEYEKQQEKRMLLDKLTLDHLKIISEKFEYKGIKRKDSLINNLVKQDEKMLIDYMDEYIDAENSTNFIFALNSEYSSYFKKSYQVILEKNFQTVPKKNKYSLYLEFYRYNESLDELSIRLNLIKEKNLTPYWDFNRNRKKIQKGFEIITVPLRVLFDYEVIIIRTRNINYAFSILNDLMGDKRNSAKIIEINKEERQKIEDFIHVVRKANIRKNKGQAFQGISFTA